jgi:hypothetical protein
MPYSENREPRLLAQVPVMLRSSLLFPFSVPFPPDEPPPCPPSSVTPLQFHIFVHSPDFQQSADFLETEMHFSADFLETEKKKRAQAFDIREVVACSRDRMCLNGQRTGALK